MHILKWVLVIVVAYTLGYFSHFTDVELSNSQASFAPDDCAPPLGAFGHVDSTLLGGKERIQQQESVKPVVAEKPATVIGHDKATQPEEQEALPQVQPEGDIATQEAAQAQQQPSSLERMNASQQSSIAKTSSITNEEIDLLVPAPFNEHVKRGPGKIREKLKEFSEASEQNDWDARIQNRMTDYLLGNSYSQFIELHSVSCKANLCEVRGRELKPNVFVFLITEMSLQDWWDIADSQWSSGGENGGVYALFLRSSPPQ